MIVSFKDKAAEDIFDGNDSKEARKQCPKNCWEVAQRKLDQLNAAFSLDDMKVPPGNRLEALKGERKVSIAFGLMTNTGFALHGHPKEHQKLK
ncbi:type II toxin-antitoxin system RelE/ParE family toxin [Nostoc sp. KVJ3]|uniref:type II toxin-antitoxin system RelE/ParE family toxin n=1 Tax=Nostoc sp. KVJ3 TaxID=457945 RepID=UPI002AA2A32A|nr:type II toxin-antitoxin system RelE/ParE family toxin [Nostoc sp. KVJ3]